MVMPEVQSSRQQQEDQHRHDEDQEPPIAMHGGRRWAIVGVQEQAGIEHEEVEMEEERREELQQLQGRRRSAHLPSHPGMIDEARLDAPAAEGPSFSQPQPSTARG
jgi:hypothetical protein